MSDELSFLAASRSLSPGREGVISFRTFMLVLPMRRCRCGYLANMNPFIEPSDKLGLEGVRPRRNQDFRLPFRLKASSKRQKGSERARLQGYARTR